MKIDSKFIQIWIFFSSLLHSAELQRQLFSRIRNIELAGWTNVRVTKNEWVLSCAKQPRRQCESLITNRLNSTSCGVPSRIYWHAFTFEALYAVILMRSELLCHTVTPRSLSATLFCWLLPFALCHRTWYAAVVVCIARPLVVHESVFSSSVVCLCFPPALSVLRGRSYVVGLSVVRCVFVCSHVCVASDVKHWYFLSDPDHHSTGIVSVFVLVRGIATLHAVSFGLSLWIYQMSLLVSAGSSMGRYVWVSVNLWICVSSCLSICSFVCVCDLCFEWQSLTPLSLRYICERVYDVYECAFCYFSAFLSFNKKRDWS